MADNAGISRAVLPIVEVNGTRLPAIAVWSIEATNASHFTADTFRVELATKGLPPALGPAYWADSQGDQVSLAVQLDGGVPFPLIVGQVDEVEADLTGRRLVLTGRDLSARFLDSKTDDKFTNRTASQIAQLLATRRGLASVVDDTDTPAGTYYQIEHAVLAREQTEWDLLVFLAEQEDFDVWVDGNTLHFQNSPVPTSTPYNLIWSEPGDGTFASNVDSLVLHRSQTLAKDIIVIVKSWNQKQQKGFEARASAAQAKSQRKGGKAQTYTFVRPNLTRDQAQKLAKSYVERITRHERVITARMPGDNALTTRTLVNLAGTGTAFDQVYYPDTVTRSVSTDGGYRMELRAKNHSTLSEVAL